MAPLVLTMLSCNPNVVRYLTDYHSLHCLEPYMRFGERVVRLTRIGPGNWEVEAATESRWLLANKASGTLARHLY